MKAKKVVKKTKKTAKKAVKKPVTKKAAPKKITPKKAAKPVQKKTAPKTATKKPVAKKPAKIIKAEELRVKAVNANKEINKMLAENQSEMQKAITYDDRKKIMNDFNKRFNQQILRERDSYDKYADYIKSNFSREEINKAAAIDKAAHKTGKSSNSITNKNYINALSKAVKRK